jgi:hypothetical protein
LEGINGSAAEERKSMCGSWHLASVGVS